MTSISSNANIKSIELEAVVIRSDGSVQNLGVISSWHRNPIVRFWRWITRSN